MELLFPYLFWTERFRIVFNVLQERKDFVKFLSTLISPPAIHMPSYLPENHISSKILMFVKNVDSLRTD
jgi:hypothetical protein